MDNIMKLIIFLILGAIYFVWMGNSSSGEAEAKKAGIFALVCGAILLYIFFMA